MANLTSRLIVELIDRVSAPSRAAGAAINGLTSRVRASAAANRAALSQVQGQLFGAVAAAYGLKQALSAPISLAADFETALLDIGQKADLSDASIKSLGDRIRALAPTINQTSAEVAKGIDTLVGMGLDPKQAETLLGPIGKTATAYNASINDLAKAGFSTLDNLKVKAEDFGKALDVMAQSGKEGAFEIKDMAAEFPSLTASAQALKMEGVTAVGRLTAALQIARKGASTGAEAATNTANLMQKIISPETTKKFTKLGVDIRKELKKTQASGGDVFEMIAAQTQKALKGDLSKLGDLFEDAQVQKFLRPLMQNLDEYKRIRDKALGAKGVVDADFARRMVTNAAQTAAFSIRLKELGLTIGNILLPSMNDLMSSISPVLKSIEQFADANPGLVGGTIKVVAALVAARVAAIAARFAFTFLKAALLGIAGPALAVVTALASFARLAVVAAVIRPVVAALAGLRAALIGLAAVSAIGGIRMGIAALAAGLLTLLNPLRLLPALLAGAALAMRGLGAAMLMIPGAAALVAIAAAGTFIYNNWKGLGTFFTSFFASLKSNLESMDGGRFKVLTDAIDTISSTWNRWTGEISDKSWQEAGTSAASSVASGIQSIADAIDVVMQKWESFKSVWNKVQDVLQYNPLQAEGAGKDGAVPPGQQKERSATDARRKAFQEDRNRLGIPVIGAAKVGPSGGSGDDVWSKGTKGVDHLNQSGEAASAGQATGTAYKSALGGQLTAAEADIMAFVQRAMAALNFSVSPTITPKFGPMPSQPGLSSANAKRAQFSDGTNFG